MYNLSRKIWFLTKGIFNNTENDLRPITKIAYVKIVLEQCWRKGFNVNSQWENDENNLTTSLEFFHFLSLVLSSPVAIAKANTQAKMRE